MIRSFAALISLAVVLSGSFALSTHSVEAKTSRNSSRRSRNYFVPPPPPYTPSMVPSLPGMTNAQASVTYTMIPSAPGMTNAQAVTYTMVPSSLGVTNAQDDAVLEKPVNSYSKFIFTRSQGDMSKVVQPNPPVTYDPSVETKVLKQIDSIDSEISSIEKEIGELLNL